MTTIKNALALVLAVAIVQGQQEVDMEGNLPLVTSRQNTQGVQGLGLDNEGHSFFCSGFETERICS